MPPRFRLTLKDWVDDTDLRTVNWRHVTLKRHIRQYNIEDGECVVFENATRNKARLVANLGGFPILLIPPIDKVRQLSVHMEVNLFLKGGVFHMSTDRRNALQARIEDLEARVEIRNKMLKAAAKKRAALRKAMKRG
jgi:hypothetical protein